MRTTLFAAAAALGLALAMGAEAADEAGALAHQTWSFGGIFGTFDQKAAQRGFQVYKEICSNCHSLKELYYRNLEEIGLTEDQVKAIAAEVKVTDGPNDQGEMFERPGKPSDHFKAPFANDQAARAANGGGLPPDLSLIVKGREGGPDYVYAILTGFTQPPAGFKVTEGTFYNAAFPGHLIKMPPPLTDGAVTYADKTKATVPQMAHDVVTFLTWAAEPELDTRHRLGVKVMIFLLVLAGLLYAVKRKVWAEVH
jgi:ubiquinol-cytochrome c reductase cytochrome c1 subunit